MNILAASGADIPALDPTFIAILIIGCSVLALVIGVLWICLPFAVFGVKVKLQMLVDRSDLIHRDLDEVKARIEATRPMAPPATPIYRSDGT